MTYRQGRHNPQIIYKQLYDEPSDYDPMIAVVMLPSDAAVVVRRLNLGLVAEAPRPGSPCTWIGWGSPQDVGPGLSVDRGPVQFKNLDEPLTDAEAAAFTSSAKTAAGSPCGSPLDVVPVSAKTAAFMRKNGLSPILVSGDGTIRLGPWTFDADGARLFASALATAAEEADPATGGTTR